MRGAVPPLLRSFVMSRDARALGGYAALLFGSACSVYSGSLLDDTAPITQGGSTSAAGKGSDTAGKSGNNGGTSGQEPGGGGEGGEVDAGGTAGSAPSAAPIRPAPATPPAWGRAARAVPPGTAR